MAIRMVQAERAEACARVEGHVHVHSACFVASRHSGAWTSLQLYLDCNLVCLIYLVFGATQIVFILETA